MPLKDQQPAQRASAYLYVACVTRHTSIVTRHSSHVTRHTSHVTPHLHIRRADGASNDAALPPRARCRTPAHPTLRSKFHNRFPVPNAARAGAAQLGGVAAACCNGFLHGWQACCPPISKPKPLTLKPKTPNICTCCSGEALLCARFTRLALLVALLRLASLGYMSCVQQGQLLHGHASLDIDAAPRAAMWVFSLCTGLSTSLMCVCVAVVARN